jgi:hypothetical protein
MAKGQVKFLDFEIDKLTNSIENTVTGEVFETDVNRLSSKDFKLIKPGEWSFDWRKEITEKDRLVYKLTTIQNPKIVHGLIGLTDKSDHIFMDLIESAKFNKGKSKQYLGVAGNLVAFGCKMSFELNYDGVVSFIAKTQLIEHYQKSLGAKLFRNNRMFIDTRESLLLVMKYYKGFRYGKF